MKRRYVMRLLALLAVMIMMISAAGCDIKTDTTGAAVTEKDAEELLGDKKDAGADAGSEAEEPEADDKEEEKSESKSKVVKTIEDVDEDLGPLEPIQVSRIVLYKDGTLEIVPTDDLRKNEMGDSDEEGFFPFEESGKVSDVWVVEYGNGGYRTIAALLDNGTISCVNGRALVEDHVVAVIDNVGGRENFVSVENQYDESGTGIVGITDTGEEVILDYSLNF